MTLEKSPQRYNYKTLDLTTLKGPDFLEKLGHLLDEAGRNGWDLVYMNEEFMVMKQLYFFKE
ncbi:MAG TPA: hypothetical protein PLK28_15520 [Candidatus Rifleibacterium sp.]|nr:hypothetical protein [Candidatus Rifleibacterium sp.]HNW12636.1 hypothetical protein [Candidatus Rifleibacterium sp.]HOI91910.1 hypothetical protein [Candidatus Rifleibacterium sp.]HPW59839.1 hypothetical protein [Candidatus Rifleibacterium sp.]